MPVRLPCFPTASLLFTLDDYEMPLILRNLANNSSTPLGLAVDLSN
jgi:hypothetical protein